MRADHRTAAALREVASRRGSAAPSKTRAEDSGLAPPGLYLQPPPQKAEHDGEVGVGAPADRLPRLMTLSEVATLLQLNERTIRRLVAGRRLPCLRLGRQLRFDPRALTAWLRAREEG